MKRGLLIGVGTLGGLGAVFAITPPQFGASTGAGGIGGIATQNKTASPAQTQAAAPATSAQSDATSTPTKASAKRTTSAAKSAAAKATAAARPAASQTPVASTPTPVAVTPTKAASNGVNGTFAGATNQTRFGPVQVQITVSNGKITAAEALQYPNGDGRSASISQQAIPYLVSQTLAAQSDQISGVGGASYTSYGFYISLQSALKKAGI